tara:strand:+ start:772 stop:1800 length:1029 start_codon:yes stop_codon:yes gene_type:complete
LNKELIQTKLSSHSDKTTWLITGVAGFIGSHLLEFLLQCNQKVIGVDNFLTGKKTNLDLVKKNVSDHQWANFKFKEIDITNLDMCQDLFKNVDFVLHQAALGSVPRSIDMPINSNNHNVTGFLNMLTLAKDKKVKRFIYASSSAVYGDSQKLPKKEGNEGFAVSPYGTTKVINELYSDVFSKSYSFKSIGLRYFNVFGERQDPFGSYAAVMPKWISSMIKNEDIFINGDGNTTRDFSYVGNIVNANILAVLAENEENTSMNIAMGGQTTLNQLFFKIKNTLENLGVKYSKEPIYREFRPGDILHSKADISKAISKINYSAEYSLDYGIEKTVKFFLQNLNQN